MADSLVGDVAHAVDSSGIELPDATELTHATNSALGEIGGTLSDHGGAGIGDALGSVMGGASDHLADHLDTTALSGLTQDSHDHVIEAMHDLPVVSQDDIDHMVHEAQEAEAHRAEADHLQHEQSLAAEQGDFAHAHDLASSAAYELHAAQDNGASVDHPLVEAQAETVALDNADWHHATAHDAAHDAGSYAAAGDAHGAEMYGSVADHHDAVAADYAHHGDHDATADASHDASAASE